MSSHNINPSLSNSDCNVSVPDTLVSIDISEDEYIRIRNHIYTFFGINLTFRKMSLIKGRMQNYLKVKGFTSFTEYINFLESDNSGHAVNDLINLISTNYTYFFRASQQFEFIFKEALPSIIRLLEHNHIRDIRIWSAGCSTGDEPYSLMITLLEVFGNAYKTWDAGILATDVCETALAEARKGVYPVERLIRIEKCLIEKYFDMKNTGNFEVKAALKKEVTFRRFNLNNTVFPFKKKFDIILCRNVMIYFDAPARENLINRLYENTRPGGYLFTGSSESFNRKQLPYRFIQPGVYQKEV